MSIAIAIVCGTILVSSIVYALYKRVDQSFDKMFNMEFDIFSGVEEEEIF